MLNGNIQEKLFKLLLLFITCWEQSRCFLIDNITPLLSLLIVLAEIVREIFLHLVDYVMGHQEMFYPVSVFFPWYIKPVGPNATFLSIVFIYELKHDNNKAILVVSDDLYYHESRD